MSETARIPLFAGAVGAVSLVGMILLGQPGAPARAADPPTATAAFQTTDRLKLSLSLPSSPNRQTVAVDLLDPRGVVLETRFVNVQGDTQPSVTFSRTRLKPDQVTVRCRQAGRSSEVRLSKILLTRAHETMLSTSTEFFAGSSAELLCKVQGVKSLAETIPLAAQVEVSLVGNDGKARPLFKGKTDEGMSRIQFQVPEVPAGKYTLRIKTETAFGDEKLERMVKVQSSPRVLLTTDKPLYQPGQTIHLRALALRAFDLVPTSKKALTFEVEDARGNKVFKKELTTSEYGIAAADFTLADEVNMGEYRIRALLGNHRSEKTVTVKKYVLPKFKVELKTNKTFYFPKETIRGTMQVDYFFGKPVALGHVEIKASTFDVAFKEFTTFKGKTDKAGHITFQIKLPDYFVGHPLASGNAIVKLEARVTDTAEHSESLTRTYPVSDQPIRVSFLPEGGRLIPGLENRIFVAALYPDGSPAMCDVMVFTGQMSVGKPIATLKTNAAGLAEFALTPRAEQFRPGKGAQRNIEMLGGTQQHWAPKNLFDLLVKATDSKGNRAEKVAALTSEPLGENVLLRLDKAIYRSGDKVAIDVHSTAGMPTVYVDVIKAGQTMLTRWLDVKDGKASTSVDLPAHIFGTLEVHAYQILATGEVIRDARVVYVNPASELKISVTPDRDVYLPGGKGILRFEVTDSAGKAMPTALGVLIVDEAVYALQEIQPGLEKVFFTLQEELLKPQAQAVYKPGENLDILVRQPGLPLAKQQTAKALLTAVQPRPPACWQIDPTVTRRQALVAQVQQIAWAVFQHAGMRDTVLVQDRKTGKWSFHPNLIATLVKSGQLPRATARDPLGGELTLETLMKMEPGFAPENLARNITQARMQNLLGPIIHLSNANSKFWLRGGKWTFPNDVVARATRLPGIGSVTAKDGWGRNIQLVKRSAKEKNATGHAQFAEVTLVSAGPDGKFGTADDVSYTPTDGWSTGWTWWTSSGRGALHAQLDQRMKPGGGAPPFGPVGPGGPWGPWGQWGGGQPGMGGFGMFGGGIPGGMPLPGGTGGGLGGLQPGAPAPRALPPVRATGLAASTSPLSASATGTGGAAEQPVMRLREYFPETLLWQPALITDDHGKATLEVPFADSITTWRLSASASSRGGLLGGTSAPLRVFQDFFVDLDLPVALTQNDEVAFPVAVYNYLKTPQIVTLELKREPWFDLIDEAGSKRSLKLEQGQVTAVRFRIRAKRVGTFPLTVEARGSKMSDAIKRSIEVVPDGKAVEQVFTDRLKGTVTHKVTIPPTAIDDASKLFVKIYPGVISQVMEGMEGMLRLPGG